MQNSNKKGYITNKILEGLFSKRYRFGERLLVKKICEENGVSRQPVMAALTSLQETGFVKIVAQVGCEVVQPTSSEIRDFYRMFAATEGLIAGLAAERYVGNEIAKLRDTNKKIGLIDSSSPDAESEYRVLNIAFHKTLHNMARSELLSSRQIANFQLSDFFVFQTSGFKGHLSDAVEEHESIIHCIERRDIESAIISAESHIKSVADEVIKVLQLIEEKETAV